MKNKKFDSLMILAKTSSSSIFKYFVFYIVINIDLQYCIIVLLYYCNLEIVYTKYQICCFKMALETNWSKHQNT